MIKRILLSFIALAISIFCFSQPGPPGDPAGGVKPDTVPITGIEILIVAGGLLGIKRFLKDKKSDS
jgi:hypothetical protein